MSGFDARWHRLAATALRAESPALPQPPLHLATLAGQAGRAPAPAWWASFAGLRTLGAISACAAALALATLPGLVVRPERALGAARDFAGVPPLDLGLPDAPRIAALGVPPFGVPSLDLPSPRDVASRAAAAFTELLP